MTKVKEENNKSEKQQPSESQSIELKNQKILKRKKEDGPEEQLEAEIKRVALDDEDFEGDSEKNEGSGTATVGNSGRTNEVDQIGTGSYNTKNAKISNSKIVYLRMLFLVKEASLVVGHKGERINKIKELTNTEMNVSENIRDTPERVLHVRGTPENVAKAFSIIVNTITSGNYKRVRDRTNSVVKKNTNDNSTNKKNKTNEGDEDDAENTTNENDDILSETLISATINLLISHHLMGYIIGKQGSKLKDIEEVSGVELFASPHQLFSSNDRILSISGIAESIRLAILEVGKTVLLNTVGNPKTNKKSIFYQPSPMYSVISINNYTAINNINLGMNLGMNVGMNVPSNMNMNMANQQPIQYYSNDKHAPARGNKRSSMHRTSSHQHQHQHTPQQSPQTVGSPVMMMVPTNTNMQPTNFSGRITYTTANAANASTFTPNFVIPSVRVVDPQYANNSQQSPMNTITQDIFIEEDFVGNVIGKDGKHINSVKETTGCSIFIAPPVPGSTKRKIVIRGTSMATQAAIMLISNKIETDKMNTKKRKN